MSFIGAAIGGIASGVGSYLGSQAQADAMKQAAALQQSRYEQNVGLETPYMNAGTNALGTLQNYLGLNGTTAQSAAMNGYQNSPFFTQMQTNAGNAAMGQYAGQGKMGGNALNALYQQNAAMDYGQYNNYLNQLSGLTSTGAGAANALANYGTQSAATQGNLISGAGAATGAGYKGVGDAANNVSIFSMLGNNSTNPGYQANFQSGSPYAPTWPNTVTA